MHIYHVGTSVCIRHVIACITMLYYSIYLLSESCAAAREKHFLLCLCHVHASYMYIKWVFFTVYEMNTFTVCIFITTNKHSLAKFKHGQFYLHYPSASS